MRSFLRIVRLEGPKDLFYFAKFWIWAYECIWIDLGIELKEYYWLMVLCNIFAACPTLEDFRAKLDMLSLWIIKLLAFIDEGPLILPEDLLFAPAINLELLGTQTFLVVQFDTEPSSHQLKEVLFTWFFASQCLFFRISIFEWFAIESRLSSHQIVLDFGR